ncbi:hydroxymethylglutaryl-CoA lyase [Alteromonas sp. AMM-1]|uniref:hydroxymethylglutaryl-CoA lyase n=1 Tax=Alteromonas sp. AMM-1 TaxID=3394233 RepID=UPI0039A67CAA
MNTTKTVDVKIAEMGPRDGLQNESANVPLSTRVELVNRLSDCGLHYIEAGSFVSPKWVPQMADSASVFAGIQRKQGVTYAALTPNMKGFEQSLAAGVDEVAVFASASEGFSWRNINCDIHTSLERFKPLLEAAMKENMRVRGYVSCIFACPYDGLTRPEQVLDVSQRLLDMGCYEISLGDTIGVGVPGKTRALLKHLKQHADLSDFAMHFHDTYGQAIANTYVSLEAGIRAFDSSVGGLGGCPYAKGASGNMATEDLVYLLEQEGLTHGVDLSALSETGHWVSAELGRVSQSKVGRAICGVC